MEDGQRIAGAKPNGALRASDRERDRVVTLLSEHAAQGRLSAEELEGRIESALRARTRTELAELLDDLPGRHGDDRAHPLPGRPPRRPRPGLSRQVTAFAVVNLVLIAVWALTGAGHFWPVWPILGWGLALVGPSSCGRRAGLTPRRLPAYRTGYR